MRPGVKLALQSGLLFAATAAVLAVLWVRSGGERERAPEQPRAAESVQPPRGSANRSEAATPVAEPDRRAALRPRIPHDALRDGAAHGRDRAARGAPRERRRDARSGSARLPRLAARARSTSTLRRRRSCSRRRACRAGAFDRRRRARSTSTTTSTSRGCSKGRSRSASLDPNLGPAVLSARAAGRRSDDGRAAAVRARARRAA